MTDQAKNLKEMQTAVCTLDFKQPFNILVWFNTYIDL